MKSGLFVIAVLVLGVSSCEKEQKKDSDELIIIAGTMCGWCAGIDSVTITKDLTIYKYVDPCDDTYYSKSEETFESDWFDLRKTLNLIDFQKINLNTCNICVDGCDSWVEIRSTSFNHRIRYGHQDSLALQEIRPFINKIHSIKNSFRTE